jgi:hypothetical protein
MSSRTQSDKTVSVAQDENNADAETGTERCATRYRERGNGATNDHITQADTFTAPTNVTQREGESGVGRDSIALDMREDDGGITSSIAGQLGNADELMAEVGTSNDGQAIVSDKQRELDAETEQGKNVVFMGDFDFADTGDDPYDWMCAIDDESRTLEQEERAAGVEAEFDRHHERAHAAHERGEEPGRANAEANRRLARSWLPSVLGTNVEEVREQMSPREDPKEFVREHVPSDLVEAVREEAHHLSERYETSGPEWSVAKRIVERVEGGMEFKMAVFDERESIKNRRPIQGQRQYIEDIDQYQWEATIEGEVTVLWEPKDPWAQQQVGLVDDGTDECKVTIWNNSYKETVLHEGDRVRITNGEPGQYNGRKTMAVSGRTEIQVIEEGDGPANQGARRCNPPNFEEPTMAEIHRRRTYRHRNPERRFSANPNKRFQK